MVVVDIEQVEKKLSKREYNVAPFKRVELVNALSLVGITNKTGVISFHYILSDLYQYLFNNEMVDDVDKFINSLRVSTY